MMNEAAPNRLQSLLFSAVFAAGLLFAGCNAGTISGPEAEAVATEATAETASGTTSPTGDHNGGCDVDPTGCSGGPR